MVDSVKHALVKPGAQWDISGTRGEVECQLAKNGAPFILCFHSYFITYGACKIF
jgi:hypothetical protein